MTTRIATGAIRCEVDRCGTGGRRLAVPGLRLCVRCGERLAGRLERLPAVHESAARMLNAAVKTVERVAGGRTPGIPLNFSAVEARAALIPMLSCWAQLVVDERTVAPPPRTVEGMTAFLRTHLRWLAAHPAAADFADEVRETYAALVAFTEPRDSRRISLGTCPVNGCGGTIAAALRSGRGGERPSDVRCSADGEHQWPSGMWGQLHRMRTTVGSAR